MIGIVTSCAEATLGAKPASMLAAASATTVRRVTLANFIGFLPRRLTLLTMVRSE